MTIEVERRVAADTDRVWDLVGDVEHWDQILPTVRQVTRLGAGGPPGIGARYELRQPGLPRAVYEITEWVPGSHFTWVASSPGVRTTATHGIRVDRGETRLTLGVAWAGPLAGVVGLLLGSKSRRMVGLEADTFARLAQDRPAGNNSQDG